MRAQGTGAATMANIAAKAKLTHGAVYRHFSNKDDLAAKEREAILQRIQSPISAVALHAQERIDETGFTGGVVLPYDDDEAMQDTLELQERLNG